MAKKNSTPEQTGEPGTPERGAAEAAAAGEAEAAETAVAKAAAPADAGTADAGPAAAGTEAAEPADAGTAAAGTEEAAVTEAAETDAETDAAEPADAGTVAETTAPAGPARAGAAPALQEVGLELSATSGDPASTGAVQTIAPVTAAKVPVQPASAPAAKATAATDMPQSTMPQSTVAPPAAAAPAGASALDDPAPMYVEDYAAAFAAPAEAAAAPHHGASPRRQREDGPEPAAALTSDRLLNKVAAPPVGGWRLWLYKATFGTVNVGDSDKVRLERAQDNLIASRLGERTRFVPVLSRKGGVGKTTVTTLLGMVLADTREDRVIAMDANPDRGTLSDRSPGSADFTARNLVKDRFNVTTFSQLSSYVARDGSRLDVLASDTDPAVAQAFDDSDYRAVTDILSKYYSIVLTDSGTGMVHSVMKGTLEKADAVVLVSGGSVDEARLASETLSWLEAHGRTDLVANATVVVNMSGGDTQVDIAQIEEHFRSRVRNVLRIPYDKHLAEGSRVELAKLRPATRLAVKELAAVVVSELTRP